MQPKPGETGKLPPRKPNVTTALAASRYGADKVNVGHLVVVVVLLLVLVVVVVVVVVAAVVVVVVVLRSQH